MNVLIADRFEPRGIDALRGAGCEVVCEPTLEGDALREAIVRTACNVLIVRGTPVTEGMLDASRNLSLVVRAGPGVETIDTQAASRRSILVANCPGKSAVAIAELTFALILALDRRLVEGVNDLRNGTWNRKEYCQARGLKGRTLGIVGLGQVGTAVARRAKAFEMGVIAWSRSLTYDRAGGLGIARCESPAYVASRSDILSIHLAAAPETEKIIGADVLMHLKPGSYVINTACPEVLDYEALATAVAERGLRVGLDVFPSEPSSPHGKFVDAILKVGGIVYGTHHIGASTDQARTAVAEETVQIVKEYVRTGRVRNCVNLCAESPAKYVLVVRHRNYPGVLAHTLNAISHAGVNVEEMENIICAGGEAGCAQIKLDGPLNERVLAQIKDGNEHVFAVSHTPLSERRSSSRCGSEY
jgi:D-3-phosphoglycerate dehydrogenase